MAQRRYWNKFDNDDTFELSTWLNGVLIPGRYSGFDAVLTAGLTLELNHNLTGYKEVSKLKNYLLNTGIVITPQGTIIKDDNTINLPINSTGVGEQRVDLIVLDHEYIDVDDGQEATYSIIQGSPSLENPQEPALTNPETQIIIGSLHLPESCTSLDQTNVFYLQSKINEFANKLQKTNESVNVVESDYLITEKALKLNKKGNSYIINNASNLDGLDINLIERTPEGTEITIENIGGVEDYSTIKLSLTGVSNGKYVPIINSFNKFSIDKSLHYLHGNEGILLKSNGDSYSILNTTGANKTFRALGSEALGDKWTKISEYRIENQFDSIRHEFDLHLVNSSGALIQRATVLVNIKQQNLMSTNLDFVNVIVSNSIDFNIDNLLAVVTVDNSSIKVIELYYAIKVGNSNAVLTERIREPRSNRFAQLLSNQPLLDNPPSGVINTDSPYNANHENETGWINPTLASGVTIVEGETLQVRKIGRKIELKGHINRDGNGELFTLPAGYFPNTFKDFVLGSGAGTAQASIHSVIINTVGVANVTLVTATGGEYVTRLGFDNISFYQR